MMNPLRREATSDPVVSVTVCEPGVAELAMVMFAVAEEGLLTVRLFTVIPAPKLAVVVPWTKLVFCAVIATFVSVRPVWPLLGVNVAMTGGADAVVTPPTAGV
jgi:hypothetical protein